MAKYAVLLADADNTLFDFPQGERLALLETLRDFALPCDEASVACYQHINEALWAALERGEVTQERLRVLRFSRWLDAMESQVDAVALSERYIVALGSYAIPLPGAEEAVRRWAQRVPVAIVTNGIAAVQRARIARSPIAAHIAALVISEEVGAAKPDPQMLYAALAQLPDADPARALMLGDSLNADIAAANRAGVDSCWFNPRGLPNTTPHRPTYQIDTLEAVDALLART